MELIKIKVNFNAHKEVLIKGGRGAGEDIIVKGMKIVNSFIELPSKDDEEAATMEDEAHYNPVTEQELSTLKSWIKMLHLICSLKIWMKPGSKLQIMF